MTVITVPANYTEQTHPTVIPICIADVDAKGNPVFRGWIERGVVPVADSLVKMAGRILLDKYRASEITEYAVHSLSRVHGENLGKSPWLKVLNRARYYAIDLQAGGRRYRRKQDVELFVKTLDALEDSYDAVADLEAKQTLEKIVEQLDLMELDDVKQLVPLMLRNADGAELTRLFGQKRNTITKRFYRGMRKAATAAGVSWY